MYDPTYGTTQDIRLFKYHWYQMFGTGVFGCAQTSSSCANNTYSFCIWHYKTKLFSIKNSFVKSWAYIIGVQMFTMFVVVTWLVEMRRQIIAFKEVKKSVKSKNVFLFMNFDINSKISFIFKKQRQSRDRQTDSSSCLFTFQYHTCSRIPCRMRGSHWFRGKKCWVFFFKIIMEPSSVSNSP